MPCVTHDGVGYLVGLVACRLDRRSSDVRGRRHHALCEGVLPYWKAWMARSNGRPGCVERWIAHLRCFRYATWRLPQLSFVPLLLFAAVGRSFAAGICSPAQRPRWGVRSTERNDVFGAKARPLAVRVGGAGVLPHEAVDARVFGLTSGPLPCQGGLCGGEADDRLSSPAWRVYGTGAVHYLRRDRPALGGVCGLGRSICRAVLMPWQRPCMGRTQATFALKPSVLTFLALSLSSSISSRSSGISAAPSSSHLLQSSSARSVI